MKSTRFVFMSILCGVLFSACNVFNKHEGYAHNSTHDYYFKLLAFSDTYKTAHPGDIVVASIDYSPVNDDTTLLSTSSEIAVNDDDSLCLALLLLDAHTGDSLSFIVDAKKFIFDFPLSDTLASYIDSLKELRLSVKVDAVLDSASFYEHKKELALWKQTKLDYEDFLIKQYIKKSKERYVHQKSGIYKRIIKKGKGKVPHYNDVVTISYQGSLLNGEVINHFTTLDFNYGAEMQVVDGISVALQTMSVGERAKIIVPSALAWGENGTSDGSIAPFTPIVFDIELKKIER